jgi:hypothetical protein
VGSSETINAIATLSGDTDSAVGSAAYTINIPTGSVKVVSENAVDPSILVPATWTLKGSTVSGGDVCALTDVPCSGTQETYSGVPANNDTISIPSASTQAAGYTLRSIEQVPIAAKQDAVNPIIAFFSNMFGVARSLAETVCGQLNGTPQCSASSANTPVTLTNQGDTANFIIVWEPVAQLNVNTLSVALTKATSSQQVTVLNGGSPGSTLDWNAAVTYANSSKNWLTVSPASGTLTNGATGSASAPVTLSANVAGLLNGTYSATVNFSGTSALDGSKMSARSVQVTLTVGNGGESDTSGYDCVSNACSAVASNATYPSLSSCNAACGSSNTCPGGPGCAPPPTCNFAANPTQLVFPETAGLIYSCTNITSCTITDSNGTSYQVQYGTSPNTAGGSDAVAPASSTVYTLQCAGEQSTTGYSLTLPVTVTVGAPGRVETNP